MHTGFQIIDPDRSIAIYRRSIWIDPITYDAPYFGYRPTFTVSATKNVVLKKKTVFLIDAFGRPKATGLQRLAYTIHYRKSLKFEAN